MAVVIFLCCLLGGIAIGLPIAWSLLLCGAALMTYLDMFDVQIMAQTLVNGADSFSLLAIPFFVLAGEIMNAGGLSKRIVDLPMKLVGHKPGGLGYVRRYCSNDHGQSFWLCGGGYRRGCRAARADDAFGKLSDQPLRWVNRFRRDHCTHYSTLNSFYYLWRFQRSVYQQAVHGWHRTGNHDGRGAYAHMVVASRAIKSSLPAQSNNA